MRKQTIKVTCLFIFLIMFTLQGCAGGPRGELEIVEDPTEDGLRQNWQEYTVYYLRSRALVYKIKDDRKVILGDSWALVSSESMMAESEIMDSTWVTKILGNNDAMFGYLVYRSHDHPNVAIIDKNSVQINYHVVATSGGR